MFINKMLILYKYIKIKYKYINVGSNLLLRVSYTAGIVEHRLETGSGCISHI